MASKLHHQYPNLSFSLALIIINTANFIYFAGLFLSPPKCKFLQAEFYRFCSLL